jgi:hypothetical protein
MIRRCIFAVIVLVLASVAGLGVYYSTRPGRVSATGVGGELSIGKPSIVGGSLVVPIVKSATDDPYNQVAVHLRFDGSLYGPPAMGYAITMSDPLEWGCLPTRPDVDGNGLSADCLVDSVPSVTASGVIANFTLAPKISIGCSNLHLVTLGAPDNGDGSTGTYTVDPVTESAQSNTYGPDVNSCSARWAADVDRDGHISILDLSNVAQYFGQTVPTQTPTAAPTNTPTATATTAAAPPLLATYDVMREVPNDGGTTDVPCAAGDALTGWGSNDEELMVAAMPSSNATHWAWRFTPNEAVSTQTGHAICALGVAGLNTYVVGTTITVTGEPAQVFCNTGDVATSFAFQSQLGYDAGGISDAYPVVVGSLSGFEFTGNVGGAPSLVCLHGPTPLVAYTVFFGGLASGQSTSQECDSGDALAGFGASSNLVQNLHNSYPIVDAAGGIDGWRFSAGAGGGTYLVCLDNAPLHGP